MLPSVGIFWRVPADNGGSTFVIDRTSLADAEPYGPFLTHPRGHYEVWEAWRRLGPNGLRARNMPTAIAWHEYEDFPRGRIVYETDPQTFIIYADRRLHSDAFVAELTQIFGINNKPYVVSTDFHYR